MAGHRRNIDDLLAAELARGKTLQAAALAVGCGEKTARRRWANPAFRRRVMELRGGIVDATIGQLVETLNEAVATLRQLMTESESDGVKLRAAVQLLETGLRAAAIDRLEQRIVELESVLKMREQ